jgi:hypothetical protein
VTGGDDAAGTIARSNGGFCSGAHVLPGPPWLLSLAIRLTSDDELVGRVLQAIDRALGEHRIGHDVEPFTRLPQEGHDRRRHRVAFDDDLVEVLGLGLVERLQREIIDYKKVDAAVFSTPMDRSGRGAQP